MLLATKNKVIITLVFLLFSAANFATSAELDNSQAKKAPGGVSVEPSADPMAERISLDYKDADISNVLRSLSYTYGLNLVTSTEVKGKITISLKDVTLAEAMDGILLSNGYNYSRKGNIIYITPGTAEGAQLISEPIILKYLKAADAQNLMRKVLSPKGDIKVDEISNMLIVTDYQDNIEKFKALLNNVDQPPQQVLIEAKIVDITSKDLRNLGVTWQVDYNPGTGIFSRHGIEAQERLKGTGTFAGPSSSISGGQFKLDTLVLKGLSANATLDALIQDQKAHLLASPSIAVLNNREARIIIGEKVPYKERTQTTTGTTETTKFIDVGTTLRVTPSINADGYITINIHPEVSSVTALLDAGPRITTREADTMVRVKEGETIVIGGLIKQEDNRTKSRVPILGYLPIIGYFFGNQSKDQTQTELAVFITPKILRSREEMIALGKTHFQEEVGVDILAASSLNAQMKLWEKAKNLQVGLGLESSAKEKWLRKSQALTIFETIFNQFPYGPKAAEAAYQAALIYYYDLGEPYAARELCMKIASDYSNSVFAPKAKDFYKLINQQLEAKAQEAINGKASRDTKEQELKAKTAKEAKEKQRLKKDQEQIARQQKAAEEERLRNEAKRKAKEQRLKAEAEARERQRLKKEAKLIKAQQRKEIAERKLRQEAERKAKEQKLEAERKAEERSSQQERILQEAELRAKEEELKLK